jgi:hypothetical protein
MPQQDAVGATDPSSTTSVDHFVRPERFTIEHLMMKPAADNVTATVPKPRPQRGRCESHVP